MFFRAMFGVLVLIVAGFWAGVAWLLGAAPGLVLFVGLAVGGGMVPLTAVMLGAWDPDKPPSIPPGGGKEG